MPATGESSTIDRAWTVLQTPQTDHLSSFPLDVNFKELPCRAALDRNGARHLLVPCIEEAPEVDNRPATLNATLRALTFGNSGAATYLDISCSDADLFPEFDDVIEDLLQRIRGSDTPASHAAAALSRLRKLFRNRLMRGLSPEAKLGLFAELSVLKILLTSGLGFSVEHWRGPLREPHDFEAPDRCIEVKALSELGSEFIVHGWDQLDTHDGRRLFLTLVTVVPDPEGTSIGELASEVQEEVDSPPIFSSRLMAAGWDADASAEDHERYTVGPAFIVPVTDSVPRLIRAHLTDGISTSGISDLRYRVSLESVFPFVVSSSLTSLIGDQTE
jgi:hypothetical protein